MSLLALPLYLKVCKTNSLLIRALLDFSFPIIPHSKSALTSD